MVPGWVHQNRTRALLLPFFALVGLLLGVLVALVARSVHDQNLQARQNSIHVAEAVFRTEAHRLEVTVRDYSWWQEAIESTINRFDPKWAENNIGAFVHRNNGIAVTLLFDRGDALRYAVVDSQVVDPVILHSFGPGLQRLIKRSRASPEQAPVPASAYIRFGDELLLAAAGAMTPEDLAAYPLAPGPRPVLVFLQRIDEERLQDLGRNYLLPGLALGAPDPTALLVLPDADGAPLAGLSWELPQPGDGVLRDLALPATVLSLVAAALMLLVYRGIMASARNLQRQNERLAEGEAIAIRALGEVAAVNQQKSRFLANVSHELRTPLNAIIGFSDAMVAGVYGPMPARHRECTEHILASGGHLLSLVDELLDLSRIEAGALGLSREAVDVAATVTSCLTLIGRDAQSSGVDLQARVPDDLPQPIADPKAFRQILINLLANAVKFTPPGGQVTVSAWARPSAGVTIQVRDTGIGMSPDDLSFALKPFGRASTPFVQSRQGTGLGLPLSKHLAEAQGAEFDISSIPGEGTAVRITFADIHAAAAPA